jgi:hypothetical protein
MLNASIEALLLRKFSSQFVAIIKASPEAIDTFNGFAKKYGIDKVSVADVNVGTADLRVSIVSGSSTFFDTEKNALAIASRDMPGGQGYTNDVQLALRVTHEARHGNQTLIGFGDARNPLDYHNKRALLEGEAQYSEWKVRRDLAGAGIPGVSDLAYISANNVNGRAQSELDELYRELNRAGASPAAIRQAIVERAASLNSSDFPSTGNLPGRNIVTYQMADIRDFVANSLGVVDSSLIKPQSVGNIWVDPNDPNRWSAQLKYESADGKSYALITRQPGGALTSRVFDTATGNPLGPVTEIPNGRLETETSTNGTSTTKKLRIPGMAAPLSETTTSTDGSESTFIQYDFEGNVVSRTETIKGLDGITNIRFASGDGTTIYFQRIPTPQAALLVAQIPSPT